MYVCIHVLGGLINLSMYLGINNWGDSREFLLNHDNNGNNHTEPHFAYVYMRYPCVHALAMCTCATHV